MTTSKSGVEHVRLAISCAVWADLHSLQEIRGRLEFSSIRLKLVPGADVQSLIQDVLMNPRINLQAKTESEYSRSNRE